MANLNLNKVIIAGHLTADPALKQTQNNIPVTSFTVAVKRGRTEDSDFINVVAWRQTAEFISKYFKKGNSICICGSIQTRNYEKDGQKRTIVEVNAEQALFIDKKDDRDGTVNADAAPNFEEISADAELPF